MIRQVIISGTNSVYNVEDEYFIQLEAGIPMYVFRVITDDGDHITLTTPVAMVAEMVADENDNHLDVLRKSSEHQIQQMIKGMQAEHEHQPQGMLDDRDYL